MVRRPYTKQHICATCGKWAMVTKRARKCHDCVREMDRLSNRERMKDKAYRDRMNSYTHKYNANRKTPSREQLDRINAISRAKYKRRMADPKYRKNYMAKQAKSLKNKKANDPVFAAEFKIRQTEYRRIAKIKKNKQALLALKLKLGNTDNPQQQ